MRFCFFLPYKSPNSNDTNHQVARSACSYMPLYCDHADPLKTAAPDHSRHLMVSWRQPGAVERPGALAYTAGWSVVFSYCFIPLPFLTCIMEEDFSDAFTDGYMVSSLPRIDSASESGDFDDAPSNDETDFGLKTVKRHSTDTESAYDLSPPPPKNTDRSAERIAERLFSADHLNVILNDNTELQRFTTFLMRYRAQYVPTLVRYLDSQKVLKAIKYANTLADQITQQPSWPTRASAASVDPQFEQLSRRALDELIAEALPAYVTFNVVEVVTELLNKEIVGRNTPVMRELVHGLAEVYCLSDPTQEGNPIVFASEGKYSSKFAVTIQRRRLTIL